MDKKTARSPEDQKLIDEMAETLRFALTHLEHRKDSQIISEAIRSVLRKTKKGA